MWKKLYEAKELLVELKGDIIVQFVHPENIFREFFTYKGKGTFVQL